MSTVTNNQLIVKLGTIGLSIRQDLEAIQSKFSKFETNFDKTIEFFSRLNTNVSKITEMYYRYHLYYVTYSVFGILCILITLKLSTLIIKICSWFPKLKSLMDDFNEFRKARRNLEEQAPPEQAYPLIHIF